MLLLYVNTCQEKSASNGNRLKSWIVNLRKQK